MSDGSYRAVGYLTPDCGALLQATLSAHAAPRPTADGEPDRRSHSQRMHDALADLAGFIVRRGELADTNGAVQLVITMTADQYRTGTGLAETSFGQLISVGEALRPADEARIAFVLRNSAGEVLAEGRSKRCATRAQTLALIARDRGCSFPDCDRPPDCCQRHHVRPWVDGGPTDVGNLTLVCGYHHRAFSRSGWRCVMRAGLPWWIPPPWLDRAQAPRLNQRIQRR